MNPSYQNYSKSIVSELLPSLARWESFHTPKTHLFVKDDTATFYLDETPIALFNKKDKGLVYSINAAAARKNEVTRFLLRERLGVAVYKVNRRLVISSTKEEGIVVEVPEVEWVNVRGFSVNIGQVTPIKESKQLTLLLFPKEIGVSADTYPGTINVHTGQYYDTLATTTAHSGSNTMTYPRFYQDFHSGSMTDWWVTDSPSVGTVTFGTDRSHLQQSISRTHIPSPQPAINPADFRTSDGRVTPSSVGHATLANRNTRLFSDEELRRFSILGPNHSNPTRRR